MHRANITVLRGSLKPKTEYVLTVPLTELQERVYRKYVGYATGSIEGDTVSQVRLFGWLAVLTLLCNHPKTFRSKLLEKRPPSKGRTTESRHFPPLPTQPSTENAGDSAANLTDTAVGYDSDPETPQEEIPTDVQVSKLGFSEAMIADMLAAMPDQLPVELSRKMQLAREILELSIKAKDKVLIFSQSLPTLGYMEELLEEMDVSYERIDGKKNVAKRDSVLQHFNDDKFHTQVLLISTRAGGVGLNIQSANRVIIMDYSFNPTWEEQAIGLSLIHISEPTRPY